MPQDFAHHPPGHPKAAGPHPHLQGSKIISDHFSENVNRQSIQVTVDNALHIPGVNRGAVDKLDVVGSADATTVSAAKDDVAQRWATGSIGRVVTVVFGSTGLKGSL